MSQFKGDGAYEHKDMKLGIVLVNLGTPKAPKPSSLRIFLRRFLNDKRVIENKKWSWKLLLNCVIIPLRAPKSAKAYASIWTKDGSPLLFYSQSMANKLEKRLRDYFSSMNVKLELQLGMSYEEPSISHALNELRRKGIYKLFVLPLYPQYSCSTVASVFDATAKELMKWRLVPDMRFLNSYHDDEVYIKELASSVIKFQKSKGKAKMLLFSFHGMPLSSLLRGDPYHCQCHKTARLVAEKLGLSSDSYKVCFQSRFGKSKWLQPYTDETLKSLPAKGVKDIQIICPGFAADCVETLEEIEEENREVFLQAGGTKFAYIPCLNDSEGHIDLLAHLVKTKAADLIDSLALQHAKQQSANRMALSTKLRSANVEYYVE